MAAVHECGQWQTIHQYEAMTHPDCGGTAINLSLIGLLVVYSLLDVAYQRKELSAHFP